MHVSLCAPRRLPGVSRWLALGLALGHGLFTLAWLYLGFVSPGFTIFGHRIAPYSAISAPLSGLGLGPTGPLMNGAFILGGLLALVGVVGTFTRLPALSAAERWTCLGLFALSPLGMVLDGLYTIEHFLPHMAGFLLGTATPVVAFPVAGRMLRRVPGWQRFGSGLAWASPVILLLVVLSLVTFDQAAVMAGEGIAGLTERVLCLVLAGCFAALSWKAFQQRDTGEAR